MPYNDDDDDDDNNNNNNDDDDDDDKLCFTQAQTVDSSHYGTSVDE